MNQSHSHASKLNVLWNFASGLSHIGIMIRCQVYFLKGASWGATSKASYRVKMVPIVCCIVLSVHNSRRDDDRKAPVAKQKNSLDAQFWFLNFATSPQRWYLLAHTFTGRPYPAMHPFCTLTGTSLKVLLFRGAKGTPSLCLCSSSSMPKLHTRYRFFGISAMEPSYKALHISNCSGGDTQGISKINLPIIQAFLPVPWSTN